MLTREMADTIVKETSLRLNRNVNIMNEKGIIIASCDPLRLGHIHEGALEVLKTGDSFSIPADHQGRWKGSQPGINLPIVFQEETVGVIGLTGDPDEIKDFGGIIKMTTELMIKQAYIATQAEWKQRTKEMVIEELLKETPSFESVHRRLDLLGIKLPSPFHLFVVQLKPSTLTNSMLVQNLTKAIGETGTIMGFVNSNRLLIIMSGLTELQMKRKLETVCYTLNKLKVMFQLVYGIPCTHLKQISQSYQDCHLALEISDPDQEVISFADLEAKALIHQLNKPAAEKLVNRVLHDSILSYAETLDVFFKNNLHIQQTADALFIHRNTLIYRLNKIKKETGYDPKQFRDAFTLQLAVWIAQKVKKEEK